MPRQSARGGNTSGATRFGESVDTTVSTIPVTWLGIAMVFAISLSGALGYAVKKWAESKQKQVDAEIDIELRRLEHEVNLDNRRDAREESRNERDREISAYIASNTKTIEKVIDRLDRQADSIDAQTDAIMQVKKALEGELGNGMSGLMRDTVERLARHEQGVLEAIIKHDQRSEERVEKLLRELCGG